MPRRCSVFGCRSNYDGEQESTPTFSLPKDPEQQKKWIKAIPTDLSKLKHPIICIKHFDEACIIRKDKVFYKGEIKEYDRERLKLTEDAIPTIFTQCPAYLNVNKPKVRRLADVESENLENAVRQSLDSYNVYIAKQSITSLADVIKHLDNSNVLPKKCIYYNSDEKLHLCFMDIDNECPYVTANITLDAKLNISVFIKKCKIPQRNLPVKQSVLKTYNELDSLISYVTNAIQKDISKCAFEFAMDILESTKEFQESECIQFCVEQMKISETPKQGRRYGSQTMILASCLFIYSPSAYNVLLKSDLLILPHPRNLRKLICNFDLSMSSFKSSAEYLKNRMEYLKPQELIVNLIMDEIYIQQQLSFKGGQIYGSSVNDCSKLAKTVQVFMVSSAFSKYKDVVTLVPVNILTAEYLKILILSLISVLEGIGFKILSLISDNNTVNRKAFELMTSNKILQSFIPHPSDESRLLFFIFDTVHILKCIRNNWVNKKNENRSLKYLDMQTQNISTAQYHHLEQMYHVEKSSILKYGHTLSTKALYPSNIQKQNVNLVLKIFNENNIIALKHIANQHPNIFRLVEQTCKFMEIIVNWWKIVNVKNAFEGTRFNDKFREPIKQGSDLQISLLKDMSIWLKNWRQSVPIADALTSQTFQALIITTDSFLKMIPYIFDKYNLEYILLGKFQSDDLESRFSSYRQLSGANYYITYMQVLENERKIRFKNTVLFSLKHKNIPLKTLIPLNVDENDNISISEMNLVVFDEIVETDFDFECIPESIVPILVVIGGYCVRKVLNKKKCDMCISWLQLDKSIDLDDNAYEFLKDKDRGKLIMPSEIVVYAVGTVWDTANKLIQNSEFSGIKAQLCTLHTISFIKVERYDHVAFSDKCICNMTLLDKLKAVCFTTSKILINNYIKGINDKQLNFVSPNTSRKIKKLKS